MMIQPLRRYHRFSFYALGVLLPVLFSAGLVARRPLVNVEPTSDRVQLTVPNGTVMVTDSRKLWGKAVDDPDVLVYWTEDEPELDSLPVNARLLGSLQSGHRKALRVPRGDRNRGYLILYSLAYQKPVAKARVPKEMP
jgi:hypothetical protein